MTKTINILEGKPMLIEDNWTYKEACLLVQKLKSKGLYANISVGSIYLSDPNGNDNTLRQVCREMGLPAPFHGISTQQSMTLTSHKSAQKEGEQQ